MALSSCGIGLIGVGRHGSRYVQHLLHDIEGVHLAAVCRRRVEEGLASLPSADIPVYGNYRALIANPAVRAVVVVTPPTLCCDICLEAVKAGKPILIEKPLAANAEDARTMVEAAERAGVLLMTAQTMRFDSTILKVKEWLPHIGPLSSATMTSHIEMTSSTPATIQAFGRRGALLEIGIHLLDLVRFLTGDEVGEAQCTMEPAPPAGPEISASVRVRTRKGILCVLDIARVAAGRVARMEWIGQNGRIHADWSQRLATLERGEGPPVEVVCAAQPTIQATLQAFTQAIFTGTTPPITGRDGLRAMEIAEACYRSAARQGAVEPGTPLL